MRKTDLKHPFLDGLVFATIAGNLGLHVRNLTLHAKNPSFGYGLKNGLNATQILEGAADATLNLASATGAQLSTAADIATSAMLSF
jgi:hypothetical protein